MRILAALAVIALATLTMASPAIAAAVATTPAAPNETTVTVGYGQYLAEAILALGAIAGGLVAFLKGALPGPARWAVELTKLDQVAARAVEAAAFDLAEDIRTKTLTADVRAKWLADAIKVFEANAAGLYRKYKDTIALKLKARIEEYINKQLG